MPIQNEYIGREEAAYKHTVSGPVVFSPRDKMFRVTWVQTTSGRVFEYDIQARDSEDAAWQVARYMFDSVYPSNRELVEVKRLP